MARQHRPRRGDRRKRIDCVLEEQTDRRRDAGRLRALPPGGWPCALLPRQRDPHAAPGRGNAAGPCACQRRRRERDAAHAGRRAAAQLRQPGGLEKMIRSDLAWSTSDRIVVRGIDLPGEILGKLNLGDMAFPERAGRVPDQKESVLFNAMVVTLVEHGVTPSALAARLTYLGAPEAMQAAVAAGLCGLGSGFVGSTEGRARLLTEAFSSGSPLVKKIIFQNKKNPGLAHPIHKPVDPRTVRLFEIARETGFYGRYCELMEAIGKEKNLVVNATGAICALACELGLDWKAVRGIGVMARAVGLVGHILEEARQPMAEAVWHPIEKEGSAHLKPKQ